MDADPPTAQADFEARLAARDLALFTVKSQTKPEDKTSLLAVQALVRSERPGYRYLEVGSHLGGTLTPHLTDRRCSAAVSIDARPSSQPDIRARDYDYPDNSSARMIELIRESAPDADLRKLVVFDSDAADVRDVGASVDLVFIDGEHTVTAVFRDFLNTWRWAAPSAVVAFHDSNLIFDGLQNIEALLASQGVGFDAFFLPLNVFVLATGDFRAPAREQLSPLAYDRAAFLNASQQALWDEIAVSRRAAG